MVLHSIKGKRWGCAVCVFLNPDRSRNRDRLHGGIFAGFCQTSAAARPKHDTSISYEPKGSLKSTLSGRIPAGEEAAIMTLSEQIEDLWINA